VALVVTREGYPLGYEVFDGNRTDVTTVGAIVEKMEGQYGKAQRVWVVDRGMVSTGTLALLGSEGRRYLAGAPKGLLNEVSGELGKTDGWETLPSGVEVRAVPSPDGTETWVICRSAARRAKEEAILDRFVKRVEESLTTMARVLERARKRWERSVVERRIGRVLERNHRASGAFRISVREDAERASGLRLEWSRDAAWMAAAQARAGCYVLRTNVEGETAASLWPMYMQLTDVEAAFRTAKTDLLIRPIWHQIERRVQGHILFSFLAYAMWKTLEGWMERAGLGRGSARTLLAELRRLKAMDVVLPTSTGRKVRLRCVPRPAPALAALLDRMGLVVPHRLGRPAWVPMPETGIKHVV
jgi:transposase